jgi:hypothetical protein
MNEFVIYTKLPKGTRLKVEAELMGGSLLKPLEAISEGSYKVRIGKDAFEALRALRSNGETIQEVVERLIFKEQLLNCRTERKGEP